MEKETPLINILTYQLPFKLANQIYNEFQSRHKEATFLIESYKTYSPLKDYLKLVELLLALSIFHRRIIANLDGAVKFYGTVTKKSEAEVVKIGNYNLTGDEKNKILAVIMNYQEVLSNYRITPRIMEYYETRDFLKTLIGLKSDLDYADFRERQKKEKGNNS